MVNQEVVAAATLRVLRVKLAEKLATERQHVSEVAHLLCLPCHSHHLVIDA